MSKSIRTDITFPITTESTHSGLTFASASAALAETVCNSVALTFVNLPPNVPKGVRLALRI